MKLQYDNKINKLEIPVLCVTLLGYLFWLGSLYLHLQYNLHYSISIPLSTLGVYTLFTPLHEATHNNISSNRLINKIVGNIVIIPYFFANFETFKYIHLEHHRYTNVPELDPDRFSRYGIISCLFMPLHYYKYYLTNIITKNKVKSNLFYVCFIYLFLYISYVYSFLKDVSIVWIIPSILGICLDAFIFDYLPHRDHSDQKNTTKMTDGVFELNNKRGNDLLSLLTCNQLTYHHIHHLNSKIAFHNYKEVWNNNYDNLQDKIKSQTIFTSKKSA